MPTKTVAVAVALSLGVPSLGWAAPDPATPTDAEPAEPVPTDVVPAEPAPAPATTPTPAQPVASAFPSTLTVQACPFAAPSLPQQAPTALDATLLVKTSDGVGSAVIISPDGFALTAAHVVGTRDSVSLVAHGGGALEATVVRVDQPQDVALIKLSLSRDSSCLLPSEARAPVGSDVFVLGSPAGQELSFSIAKGIVSAYRTLDGSQFVQLDASLNPGNSGGPVVSTDGRIIGIASWKVSHVSMEGLAFAVPIDATLQALGVELGAASSADWADLKGRNMFDSAAKPRNGTATATPPDASLLRRRRVKRGLVTWGATMLGTGVTAVAITAAIYYRRDEMTKAGWTAARATNTVGWGLAIGGAAMLIAGLVLPKQRKPERAGMHVLPSGRGLVLHGRF